MSQFVTAYGPKLKPVARHEDDGLTRQEMAEECDINNIMKKYAKTGVIEHRNTFNGEYGEFLQIDYHEALNMVIEAREMFETIPAKIRAKFENDPAKFLEFVKDEKNNDELIAMGLVKPKPP